MGVLSFNPRREGRFVIPRYCLVQLRGGRTFRGFTRWNNEVVAPLRNPINTDFPVVRDGGVRISERIPLQPYAWWEQRVRQTLRLIDAGLLVKLVLARSLELRTTGLVSPGGLFVKLGRSHPGIYSYCFRISDRECFVGAIPELLVERTGQLVRSRPFAGTVPLSSFSHPRAAVRHLMENNKIAREHSITLHHVRDALLNYSSGVVTSQPSAVQLATVAHLASSVECRLPPSSTVSSLDLAYSLHPTPAVADSLRNVQLRGSRCWRNATGGSTPGPSAGWMRLVMANGRSVSDPPTWLREDSLYVRELALLPARIQARSGMRRRLNWRRSRS